MFLNYLKRQVEFAVVPCFPAVIRTMYRLLKLVKIFECTPKFFVKPCIEYDYLYVHSFVKNYLQKTITFTPIMIILCINISRPISKCALSENMIQLAKAFIPVLFEPYRFFCCESLLINVSDSSTTLARTKSISSCERAVVLFSSAFWSSTLLNTS